MQFSNEARRDIHISFIAYIGFVWDLPRLHIVREIERDGPNWKLLKTWRVESRVTRDGYEIQQYVFGHGLTKRQARDLAAEVLSDPNNSYAR